MALILVGCERQTLPMRREKGAGEHGSLMTMKRHDSTGKALELNQKNLFTREQSPRELD